MFIEIDLQSEVPLYTQLAEQLIVGMASGVLKPGESLPSVRSLAADLGINLHTVNKAYNVLKQDGFLQVHRKQGVIVSAQMPEVTDGFRKKLDQQLKPMAAEAAVRGMSEDEFTRRCLDIYRKTKDQRGES